MDKCQENVIEWVNGDNEATCTFSQLKYINRIRRMSKKHPELIKIHAENPDGSILATIPLKALHLTIYSQNNKGFLDNINSDSEE